MSSSCHETSGPLGRRQLKAPRRWLPSGRADRSGTGHCPRGIDVVPDPGGETVLQPARQQRVPARGPSQGIGLRRSSPNLPSPSEEGFYGIEYGCLPLMQQNASAVRTRTLPGVGLALTKQQVRTEEKPCTANQGRRIRSQRSSIACRKSGTALDLTTVSPVSTECIFRSPN